MSVVSQCDKCKKTLAKEGPSSEPWLKKYGDMQGAMSTAVGPNSVIGFGGKSHVTDESERLKRPEGKPGYEIARGEDELVSLWVSWRDGDDFCRSCIESAIRKLAGQIGEKKQTGDLG